ncbi:MAG: hypothetical protein J6R20_07570 [Clostridia bacterium]|nr:hypothetical protein [Clostridia bacterium]
MSCRMKKSAVAIVSFVMVLLFSFPSFSYYMNNKDLYGEPEKSYEDGYEEGYEDGYADGYEDNGGEVIYRTRKADSKNDSAVNGDLLSNIILTVLSVVVICATFFMLLL